MILFANEPPTYRDAMFVAFRRLEGEDRAMLLPATAAVEDAIRQQAPAVVVVSGPAERARRLSMSVPVVNLTYGPGEQGTSYRDGVAVRALELRGFEELVRLIDSATDHLTRS